MTTIVSRESPLTVDETVERLEEVIAAKGLTLFAVFDHSGEAQRRGLRLRATKVVVFGSPAAGRPVMDHAPLSALDLPLKVLVWDDDGTTRLAYTAPAELGARYDLSADLLDRLRGIETIVESVSGA